MVDRLLIERKLSDLLINIAILEDLKNISIYDLRRSVKDQWSIFYGLQISIQMIIDIGNHILADLKENQIEEYIDIIDKLGEREIIPEEFAKRIRGITGLRNLLVHEYGIIDIEKIYNLLQHNISDFEEFHDYIEKYMME